MTKYKYELANYDGGVPAHPEPEEKGYLLLNAGSWELHFKRKRNFVHGGLTRYQLEVTPVDATSCRVRIIDPEDGSVVTTFDLPGTSAERLSADLQGHGQEIDAGRQRLAAIDGGQWWLNTELFKTFGLSRVFSITETDYLGGWSEHPKGHKRDILQFSQAGVSYKAFRTIFSIPWEQVADIVVEGPEQASRRVTATRLLTIGVFALAAKKKSKSAVIIVQLKSGEEACFHTEKLTTPEVRAKLTPVTSQLRRAATQARQPPQEPATPPASLSESTSPSAQPAAAAPPPAAGLFVADELIKLGQLRDAGVITDEQFAVQRDRLMS